jgi:hypothetical protein
VDDRGDLSRLEVLDRSRPADGHPAQRLEELLGDPRGLVERDLARQRHRIRGRRRVGVVGRGDVEREEAAGEARLGGGLEVDVLALLTPPPPQHEIVVTVDHHVTHRTGAFS